MPTRPLATPQSAPGTSRSRARIGARYTAMGAAYAGAVHESGGGDRPGADGHEVVVRPGCLDGHGEAVAAGPGRVVHRVVDDLRRAHVDRALLVDAQVAGGRLRLLQRSRALGRGR